MRNYGGGNFDEWQAGFLKKKDMMFNNQNTVYVRMYSSLPVLGM